MIVNSRNTISCAILFLLGILAAPRPALGQGETHHAIRWEYGLDVAGLGAVRWAAPGRDDAPLRLSTTVGTSGAYRLEAAWVPRRAPGGLLLAARASTLDRNRFYGFGNATDASLAGANYRLKRFQAEAGASFNGSLARGWSWSAGPLLKVTRAGEPDGEGRDDLDAAVLRALRPYGVGSFAQVGLRASTSLYLGSPITDARPTGLAVDAAVEVYPTALDVTSPFATASVEVRAAAALPLGTYLTTRGVVTRIVGAFPYHEAAYLGGSRSLRGFQRQRYAGDAAVSASVELWGAGLTFAGPFRRTLRAGPMVLADVGRVYLNGASPGGWHVGSGAGVWLEDVASGRLVTVAVAAGAVGPRAYVSLGVPLARAAAGGRGGSRP